MVTRRRERWYFLVLLCWLVAAAGCDREPRSEAPTAGGPRSGGVYRIPLSNTPPSLDPARVQDEHSVAVVHQLFDGLVRYDDYLAVMPALAESWTVSDGGRRYRFRLRPGARFHDGAPITAADVIFSLERLLKIEPAPAIQPHLLKISGAADFREGRGERVAGLRPIDDHTVEVLLDVPHAPFLTSLGMYQAKIVPERAVAADPASFGRRPVGSGPFRLTAAPLGPTLQLERFADYYAVPALLEELHYRIYTREQYAQMLADFRQGRLHELPVYGDLQQELADLSGLQWVHRPSLSLFFYGVNCRHPLLKQPALRRALAAALDGQVLVDAVYGGRFEVARTVLPPGMPGYTPANRREPADLSRAQRILREAFGDAPSRWPPLEIVSAYQTERVAAEMALVRQAWEGLGLRLEVKYITDWAAFERYLGSDEVQLFRYVWYADMPDPDSFLAALCESSSPANLMGFADEAVDRLLVAARASLDPVERADLYRRVETRVLDAMPLLPLFYLSVDRVYQAGVQGVQVSPLGAAMTSYNRMWLTHAAP